MTEQDDDIPDDKLLDMPEEALPGDLSRLWAIRSNLLHQRETDELNRELAGDAYPRMLLPWDDPREMRKVEEKRRREQLANEQAIREISERQDRLLQRIEEEEARIDERRREIDDNALRLRDGRRVYVDGDRYRDGQGTLLTGSDEAEAARQHEYRPDASTWQQKQDIDHRYAEAKKLKNEILADRQGGQGTPQDEAKKLDGYEKEFADKIEAKASQPVTDYAAALAMDGYQLSSVPAFTAAADPASVEASRKPSDTGSQTADIKKPAQPFGGDGIKLG